MSLIRFLLWSTLYLGGCVVLTIGVIHDTGLDKTTTYAFAAAMFAAASNFSHLGKK